MNDAQLTWIFKNRLSSHNGFRCGRHLMENGVKGTEYICEGKTSIINGRLKYTGTCGEPCSFICDDANSLQDEIDTVIRISKIIDEARKNA